MDVASQPRLCPVDFMYCLLYVYLDCHKTHGDYDCSICGYSSVVAIFHCAVARLQKSYLVQYIKYEYNCNAQCCQSSQHSSTQAQLPYFIALLPDFSVDVLPNFTHTLLCCIRSRTLVHPKLSQSSQIIPLNMAAIALPNKLFEQLLTLNCQRSCAVLANFINKHYCT